MCRCVPWALAGAQPTSGVRPTPSFCRRWCLELPTVGTDPDVATVAEAFSYEGSGKRSWAGLVVVVLPEGSVVDLFRPVGDGDF